MQHDGLQLQDMFVGLEVKVKEMKERRFDWIVVLGICEIEQTEKGWYLTLIDKDPDAVKREMESERKERMDLDDEQRRQKLIAEQVSEDKMIEFFKIIDWI